MKETTKQITFAIFGISCKAVFHLLAFVATHYYCKTIFIIIEIQFEYDAENIDTAEDYAYDVKNRIVNIFAGEKSKVVNDDVIEISECE